MNHYPHYPPPPLPTEEYLPPPPPPPPPEDHPPSSQWPIYDAPETETSVSDIISPQPSPPPPPPPPEKAPERTTISDDRSAGSNLEVRNLAALKDRTAPRVDHADEYWPSPAPPPPPPFDPNIPPPPAPKGLFETSARIKKSKKKRKMTSEYDSSRGHVRLQQRFGRLHLEGVTTNDVYDQNQDQSKDNPFGNSSPDSHRHSRPEPVSREHWVQNVERVDTTSRLQTDIEVLQHKVLSMQNELRQLEMQKSMHVEKQYQILYRIENICYFDHPEWSPGHKNIVSRIPVKNLDLFLERNKRIVFIVYRDFNIPVAEKETKNASSQPNHDTQPRPAKESIQPVSRRLRKALEIMLKHDWRYEAMSNHLRQAGEVSAPYLFVYHNRRYWKDMLAQFPQAVREHLNFLAIYVSENYGHEYKAADTALAQRKITAGLVKYLFQPGDILLSQTNGQYRGLVANSWPQEIPSAPAIVPSRLPGPPMIIYPHLNSHHWQYSDSEFDNSDVDLDPIQSNSDPAATTEKEAFKRAFDRMHPWFASKEEELAKSVAAAKANKEFNIKVWKWSFDGDFKREGDKVTLRLSQAGESTFGEAKTWNIHELDIYPLRFAPHALAQDLRRRGEMFWECRKRCLISYRETSPEAQNESDERFMIDFHTFRKLHPENKSHAISDPTETMSQAEMEQAQPPDEAFYYLVPLQTKGFNLRSKKWLDLNMDQITPVDWNQKAFDSLVLDRKTKELITALVSKQISAAKSTDVIAGKGNGLILLLHGGPGTGKTLTAEGVAEIAKKPLYRVTCGDVGTKAEEVEGYLESVLHLGKIWDCVVLLDEAEVFLERRSLDDLQRNALVSVFLRVIEYHEGILILTSNRVGTFDEAFRSRIQIAVHYPPLRAFQRLQIWRNFFDRLESFKDGTVDVDELRDHLEELQEVEINGRQIRNAITTARQYAEWKGKVMNYEHLKTALDVASKFDDYSEKLRGGLTDDQIAEEEGIR